MKKQLITLKNNIKWNLERLFYRVEKSNVEMGLPNGKKIILAPHSDDEWIGCSQILKNEEDSIIINMDMSGNDKKNIHKIRYNEMLSTANMFNLKMITLGKDKVNQLNKIIKKENPKYICVPYYIDWHEEHIKVMNILKCALSNCDELNIIMYQVSLPMYIDDITNYKVLNRDNWKDKWKHFKNTYRTQSNFPYYRFAANERINGKSFRHYAVEVYSIVSSTNWNNDLNKRLLTNNQRDDIKKILYSIKKTRNYLNKIKKQI